MNFLRCLEQLRTPFFDQFFQFCTYFGEETLITVMICLFYWCISKPLGYEMGLTFFGSGLTAQAMKLHFRIPRPWILDSNFHAVESSLPGATGYSFPSGHTQGSTSLFFPLALHARKKGLRILCCLPFLIVGFSRMYLGCHTPADVITGLLMTLVIGSAIHIFIKRLQDLPKENLILALVLALFSILAYLYAVVLTNRGSVTFELAIDCCKAAGAGVAFAIGLYFEKTFIKFSTDGTRKEKTIRFCFGIVILLLLQILCKKLFPVTFFMSAFRYFLLILWVMAIYPFLIRRYQDKKYSN